MSMHFKAIKKQEKEQELDNEKGDAEENNKYYHWLLVNGGFDARELNRFIWQALKH